MTTRIRPRFLTALLAPVALGCQTEDATTVVVDNDYAMVDGAVEGGVDGGAGVAGEITVYKVWWAVSLLPDPVSPGREGQSERAVLDTDFAYALLAPGWDPSATKPPTRFIPVKSAAELTVARGDLLHIHVSDATFVGNCAAGKPLTQADADFITQRIFPDEFVGVTYRAATCATSI